MLHIGHFSFDAVDQERQVLHGYFTCVVNAEDVNSAVKEFRDHLLIMKKDEQAFAGIVKVYLEDIIQIQEVPNKPIVTRLQSSEGQFPRSVSHSLPAVEAPGIESFEWILEDKNDTSGTQEYPETTPFMRFDE
jgi:hypothetical protein